MVVCKIGWMGEPGVVLYKQHSIVFTGNFNADFKLLTHNRYLVLNGHIVRQIHPSSFKCLFRRLSFYRLFELCCQCDQTLLNWKITILPNDNNTSKWQSPKYSSENFSNFLKLKCTAFVFCGLNCNNHLLTIHKAYLLKDHN